MLLQSHRYGLSGIALVLLLCACGDSRTSVEPELSPRFSESVGVLSEEATWLARYSDGPPQLQVGLALALIGPRGGSLRLGGFEIIVPPGAVDALTTFSIYLPLRVPLASELVMAEFGPHNRTFRQPVTIRAPYDGTTADSETGSRILWWTGAGWQPYPTRLLEDGRLETTTTHFSEWGVEQPSRGITTAGGRPYR